MEKKLLNPALLQWLPKGGAGIFRPLATMEKSPPGLPAAGKCCLKCLHVKSASMPCAHLKQSAADSAKLLALLCGGSPRLTLADEFTSALLRMSLWHSVLPSSSCRNHHTIGREGKTSQGFVRKTILRLQKQ